MPAAGLLAAAEAAARLQLPPDDVHGVLDAVRHLGVDFTPGQFNTLSTVPYSPGVLDACAGTHLLVAGCPLSILGPWADHPDLFWQGIERPWYADEPFARDERVAARWYLFRKGAVPDSTHKTYDRQVAMLTPAESVPRASEVVYADVLHHRADGEMIRPAVGLRCRDRARHGARVQLRHLGSKGLYIGPEWHDYRSGFVGVAACRQPP